MVKDDNDFFESLQKMSDTYPDKVEVYIDEDGEIEFEIDYDFFMGNFENFFGF